MSDLKYPEWQIPYQEALMELDQRKLRLRIGLAEGAISARLELIRTASQRAEEIQALRDAQNGLRGLKNEALRFGNSQEEALVTGGVQFQIN